MTFSLAKLVFDNEVCGQALHLVQDMHPTEDVPITDLVRGLLDEGQLLTSDHTLINWSDQFYIPGQIYDRQNRHAWEQTGKWGLLERAGSEVDRRLAQYYPIETDPRIEEELRRLIRTGLSTDKPLPEVPKATYNTT